MRVVTLNVNGIRSAAEKGLFPWLRRQNADVVCLQEVRAQTSDLDPRLFFPRGYQAYFCEAEKRGYSGVAIYARRTPERVTRGFGWPEIDREGRYLRLDFPEDLSIISMYVPSGSSGELRQGFKMSFLARLTEFLSALRSEGREFIICGDFNIAHRKIDLENWRGNQKNSGFLPEERAWMDALFDSVGFVDAFRVLNQAPQQYTWWSNRGQAWAKNVGWRLDYQFVTPGLVPRLEAASIYKKKRFSDHAPLTMDYREVALDAQLEPPLALRTG